MTLEIVRWYGARDMRMTVRLNRVQMWGLQILADKEDLKAADLARGIIADWLWEQRRKDPGFRKNWDAVAEKAARTEAAQ